MSPAASASLFPSVAGLSLGVQPKRWTRGEYYALAEQGWFCNQRVELIDGEIVVTPPQGFPHFSACDGVAEKLRALFSEGFWVRQQAPLAVGDFNDPEPDVSVVSGARSDYADHATTAALVVEVAQTSLKYDLQVKPAIYAAAGATEYWVVDIVNRRLHVFRGVRGDGTGYDQHTTLAESDNIAPLAKPSGGSLVVAELFPKAT